MQSLFPLSRRKTVQVKVGSITMGGNSPVIVQSMTSTDTRDVEKTLEQISRLKDAGCEIVRIAVPDKPAVKALSIIKERVTLPVVADIHFNHKLAIDSIEAGCDKIRINPGNIGGIKKVEKIVQSAEKRGIPIRIGVNAGSLDKHILRKYGYPSAEALAESALEHIKNIESMGYKKLVLSVKASDVERTVAANRILSRESSYPLHLGVTESGDRFAGSIKSAAAMGILLAEGIGDTIRFSLTGDPVAEVEAAYHLLRSLRLRDVGIEFIACPTCGRCEVDVEGILHEVQDRLKGVKTPLRVAIMGCAVNGPGEAREADIGIAGGKDEFLLFMKGKIVKKIAATDAVRELVDLIKQHSK